MFFKKKIKIIELENRIKELEDTSFEDCAEILLANYIEVEN